MVSGCASFRSKPTTIQARQFDREDWEDWNGEDDIQVYADDPDGPADHLMVRTTSGQWVMARDEDWVIREPNGQGYYPCSPDVFEKRWEPKP